MYVDPIPAQLEAYYAGGYQTIPESVEQLRSLAKLEQYRLIPILGKAGGDLLEIGPWIGIFSINAKDAGFKVDAIEMSAEATAFLRTHVGISVINTHDPAAALRDGKCYDVIALWHSLEHLPEPWKVIEAASRRLKPDGVLLIAIPNIASLQSKLLKSKWFHLDAPRHLYFWAPMDLERLVNRFGLKTVKIDTNDELSVELSHVAWFNYFSRAIRVPKLRGGIARMLTPVANALTQRKGQGAGLTATFRLP